MVFLSLGGYARLGVTFTSFSFLALSGLHWICRILEWLKFSLSFASSSGSSLPLRFDSAFQKTDRLKRLLYAQFPEYIHTTKLSSKLAEGIKNVTYFIFPLLYFPLPASLTMVYDHLFFQECFYPPIDSSIHPSIHPKNIKFLLGISVFDPLFHSRVFVWKWTSIVFQPPPLPQGVNSLPCRWHLWAQSMDSLRNLTIVNKSMDIQSLGMQREDNVIWIPGIILR